MTDQILLLSLRCPGAGWHLRHRGAELWGAGAPSRKGPTGWSRRWNKDCPLKQNRRLPSWMTSLSWCTCTDWCLGGIPPRLPRPDTSKQLVWIACPFSSTVLSADTGSGVSPPHWDLIGMKKRTECHHIMIKTCNYLSSFETIHNWCVWYTVSRPACLWHSDWNLFSSHCFLLCVGYQ